MASHTGLEFARWVLAPGKWVHGQVASFWSRYLYFVGIRQENDQLRLELDAAKDELTGLRENASEVERLRRLLSMTPPVEWTRLGARIISHRLGPNAALETFLIDKGSAHGVIVNMPVVSPEGVVGRVLRISPTAATILLTTDPNSRIPVVSQKNRTQGIVKGEGPTKELTLQYVPQGAPIEEGEILVTSGLEEIFPKGLPVARVTSVGRSGASLFQLISALPLFSPLQLEEVALLFRATTAQPAAGPPPAAAVQLMPVSPQVAPGPAAVPGKPTKAPKTPAAIPPAPGQGAPLPVPVPVQPAAPPVPAVQPAEAAKKREAAAPSADAKKREAAAGEAEKKRRKPARTEGQ
ncbi:rod shape-determining protein MreC [Solidesulfovibrio sp.]